MKLKSLSLILLFTLLFSLSLQAEPIYQASSLSPGMEDNEVIVEPTKDVYVREHTNLFSEILDSLRSNYNISLNVYGYSQNNTYGQTM